MREQVRQIPGDLGARLRALRERYPTLAITTEIIHQTDRLITFRATITIEGLVRAQGHAAQRAEPTGAFVTATETMAVEQALLLGGFASSNEGGHATAALVPAPPSLPQVSPPAARAAVDQEPSISAPITEPTLTANETDEDNEPSAAAVQAALPVATTGTADEVNAANPETGPAATDPAPPVAPRPKRDRQAERARAKARAASAVPPSDAVESPTVSSDALPLVDESANVTPPEDAAETASATPTERIEAPATFAPDTSAPVVEATSSEVAEPAPAPEDTPMAEPTTDEVVSIQPTPAALAVDEPAAAPAPTEATLVSAPETDAVMPTPTQPAAPRRSRTRSVATTPAATAPAATAATDTPPTREALREAWQVGRPIPAWWPQGRPLVTQPIGKTRVGRLRALALDEEISTSLLDTYSTLLFGVPVAGLDQTQSMILEERLNPAYPSPLEELRVRRIIHPLAVSDEMAITEGQPFFVRWSDVPPVEEAPEPPAPPTITWRERGKKGGGRRR